MHELVKLFIWQRLTSAPNAKPISAYVLKHEFASVMRDRYGTHTIWGDFYIDTDDFEAAMLDMGFMALASAEHEYANFKVYLRKTDRDAGLWPIQL